MKSFFRLCQVFTLMMFCILSGRVAWASESFVNPQLVEAQAEVEDFSLTRAQLQSVIQKDRALAKSPEHATRILDRGFKTEKAILILHGLHESPAYMQGFAKYFESKGYNVLALRLPGHLSAQAEEINQVSAQQWISAAEQAFTEAQMLGRQVEILGYSTGGTLAMYLALEHPSKVGALYLVSPALALSNRVFFSTLFSKISPLNINRLCRGPQLSHSCKMALGLDPQLKLMLQEGLSVSLAAGKQVQVLIDLMLQKFNPRKLSLNLGDENYYQLLEETYLQLKVPVMMVNSASDIVIKKSFNQTLIRKYLGLKSSIYFSKELKISHLMMNKSESDAFKDEPGTINPYFPEILHAFDQFQLRL